MIIHQLWYSPFHYKYLWGRHMVFLCPYSGVPWCLEKHPLHCFEQMQLQISPVMFKEIAWIKSSKNFTNFCDLQVICYLIPHFTLSKFSPFLGSLLCSYQLQTSERPGLYCHYWSGGWCCSYWYSELQTNCKGYFTP